jgi:hypothetical protein
VMRLELLGMFFSSIYILSTILMSILGTIPTNRDVMRQGREMAAPAGARDKRGARDATRLESLVCFFCLQFIFLLY